MASRVEKFTIDKKVVDKIVKVVIRNAKLPVEEIDFKQFFIDVVTRNYKVDKKNVSVLIGSAAFLVTPIDVLTFLIFGRIAFVVDTMLNKLL